MDYYVTSQFNQLMIVFDVTTGRCTLLKRYSWYMCSIRSSQRSCITTICHSCFKIHHTDFLWLTKKILSKLHMWNIFILRSQRFSHKATRHGWWKVLNSCVRACSNGTKDKWCSRVDMSLGYWITQRVFGIWQILFRIYLSIDAKMKRLV